MGFALGGGIKLNAPLIGMGDYFQAEVDYSQGALRYLNHSATVGDFIMYHGQNFGYGILTDAVYGAGGDLQLTTRGA